MLDKPRVLVGYPSAPVEENCACPDNGLPPMQYPPVEENCAYPDNGLLPPLVSAPVPGSAWQVAAGLHRTRLTDQHELIFNPFGRLSTIVLNQSAQHILDSFSVPRSLEADVELAGITPADISATSRQLIDLGLLLPPGHRPQPVRAQPSTLTAWMHVTNACNLRCSYCYIHKSDEAMDETTGRAAVAAVFRSAVRNGFRAVKLKYAGGEATLNFKLIQELHHYAAELAAQTGLELREAVLSNGVALTRAMIAFMRDAGMRLMISLDGIGAAHDAQRTFVNGRGSFVQVARAIERAVQHGLLPDLSITVTGGNAATLPEAVAFALDRDLRFNLNFYRENDCAASHAELLADQHRLIAGMRAAFAVIEERLPRQRLIDGLVDRSSFDQPHEHACGAGHSYMVIDQHGRVARCQMEIERPIADVLADDPLEVIRLEPSGFQNVPVADKVGCRDCTWRYWCAGGCSLLTFRATGRSDVQSPYCNVYKALYPDAIRLEGLRLLKWADAA